MVSVLEVNVDKAFQGVLNFTSHGFIIILLYTTIRKLFRGETMKKKLLTTSIATTLVLGSIAGLPLSTNGVAQKLGITGVAHASALDDSGITARMKAIYGQLSDDEKGAISAARTKLREQSSAVETVIRDEIWSKIQTKITEKGGTYPALTETNVVNLFKAAVFPYDENFAGLAGAIADTTNRSVMSDLAKLAGVTTSNNDLADAKAFGEAVEAELETYFKANSNTLVALYLNNNIDGVKSALGTVIGNVIAKSDLKVSQALSGLGIDGTTIVNAYGKVNDIVDVNNAALKALTSAYARSKTTFAQSPVSGNWRQIEPSLKVFNFTSAGIPLDWTIATNQNVSVEDRKFKLHNTFTSSYFGSHEVTASLNGNVLFKGNVTLSFTAPNSNVGGGPGGGGAPASSDFQRSSDSVTAAQKLAQVAGTISEILKGDKGNAQAQATEAVEQAIREAATINASSAVKVEGGVAKATLDANKFDKVFKTIGDMAKTAKENLEKAAPGASVPKVIATLDLGTVDAKTAEIPLSKELIDKAKANGIDVLAIKINGVTLAIDLSQLGSNTTITIKSSASTLPNAASEQFDLTFTTANGEIKSFSEPVEVRLPVKDVTGKDTELLVFSKVEDNGSLTPKGGEYNGETKEFVVMNKSFSKYVIVENKITFGDVASVKDWAGRQIQVAAAKGILDGRAANQFVPNDSVTRAEFAKMIVKTFGLEDASAKESFGDVLDTDWFQPYVAAAVKAGIVNGRSDTSFEPNATVTRAEMATMASRALNKILEYKSIATVEVALKGFTDSGSIHSTLQEGVALAAEQGIVVGEENNKFNPNADSTRAQAAVVIYRLLNK
jgi:hypothetical protein